MTEPECRETLPHPSKLDYPIRYDLSRGAVTKLLTHYTRSDLRPLVTHSSCRACVSGRSFRRQTPHGVTSKVRTVCSSSCKYGSVRGVAGNGHPYGDGLLSL